MMDPAAQVPGPKGEGRDDQNADQPQGKGSRGWHDTVVATGALLLPALLGLILYAIPSTRVGIGAAVLTASASFAVGALFGFIFGIPRTLSAPASSNTPADGHRIAPNTNLEQISDWLTKIIVGIGLVELTNISGGLRDVSDGLAESFGGGSAGQPAALTVILAFLILGFIAAYLFTRLRLEGAFSLSSAVEEVRAQADTVSAVKEEVEKAQRETKEAKDQAEKAQQQARKAEEETKAAEAKALAGAKAAEAGAIQAQAGAVQAIDAAKEAKEG